MDVFLSPYAACRLYALALTPPCPGPPVCDLCYPSRIHALYFTDKVCSQPLTPALHLSDLRSSVPGYTEQLARTLKASVETLGKLRELYLRFSDPAAAGITGGAPARDAEIQAGIPYMLRGR